MKNDSDDCAIWVNSRDPMNSYIIGNDKSSNGALYVWDMNGKEVFKTETINRPVNLDIRYGINIKGEILDIVACGVRSTNEIKVFKFDPQAVALIDITAEEGIVTGFSERSYGLSLYKNPRNGSLYAFVSKKETADIHQILLEDNGEGRVKGALFRSFSKQDQRSFVEGMCVDDELGFLYCADETLGILKYFADPDKGDELLGTFALNDGIVGDREGVAIYDNGHGEGYLLLSSQGNSSIKVYERQGNNAFRGTVRKVGSQKTDGIAVSSKSMKPRFPYGIVVCHNDETANFVVYDWEAIEDSIEQ